MRRLTVGLVLSLAMTAQAIASPGLTIVATGMRAAPNSHSALVQSIPRNAEIDIGGCGPIWCSASWRNIEGFVRASAIEQAPGAPPFTYYDAPPPVVVAPPPVFFAPFGCCYGDRYRRWH